MKVYLLKRVALAIAAFFFLATIMFIMFRILPGDPTMTVLSPALSPEVQKELKHRFGLDRPIIEQYFTYMKKMFMGDFGISFQHGIKANTIIAEKFWNTIFLMVPSLFLAYLLGIIVGAYIGWKRDSKIEVTVTVASIVFRSGPIFWVAIIFILLFAVKVPLFPAGHMRTPGYIAQGIFETFFSIDFLYHLILPMSCMAIYNGCYPLLIMRTSMLEVMGEDFIELSKAKGLSESRVIFRHAMRTFALAYCHLRFPVRSLRGGWKRLGGNCLFLAWSWQVDGQFRAQFRLSVGSGVVSFNRCSWYSGKLFGGYALWNFGPKDQVSIGHRNL